jgi:hypothetical protein
LDAGACLGCGLGINAPLQTDTKQIVTWQSGKPNPFPIFKNPYEFYTPFLIPGPYMPVNLIAPWYLQDGILHHPLSNADLADTFIAFNVHEGVHITQLLGIIPTTERLAAANFYTTLVILLSQDFDSSLWGILNRLNYAIKVIHNATAAMHEVAAIVENQFSISINNPYCAALTVKSAINYADEKNFGTDFMRYYDAFYLLIKLLKEYFSPVPLASQTIIALADYIISSAIDLQELVNQVLQVPFPIADTSLRDYLRKTGISYLEGGKRSLNSCPSIHTCFGGFTVSGIGPRLFRTIESILSAKVKRPRKMPEDYIDQLLCIAELAPELKLWLKSMDARYWLKRRIINVISDYQAHLEQYGVSLPLTGVWQSDLSAFIAVKTGVDGEVLHIVRIGSEPEDFRARAAKIPDKYWVAYDIQKDMPLGVIYRPVCIDGMPISPGVSIICPPNHEELCYLLMNLIFFESLRMQLEVGCGLVCPFKGTESSCCGRAGILWQVYNLGLKAIEKADWHPTQWIAPECQQSETNRILKANSPIARISQDSNIFL